VAYIHLVDPSLATPIKFIRQYKACKVVYDVEMVTPAASQAVRDAYGLFWRRRSGRRLPDQLRGISFANASTFSTRVRVRLLKEISRHHQAANPSVSCYVTNYLARPELKVRERRGPVSSFTYTQAIQKFPQHLTLDFLRELFLYARTNLPQSEVVERFLILTPDLVSGIPEPSEPMIVDENASQPPTSQPPPSTPPAVSTPSPGGETTSVAVTQATTTPPSSSQATSPTYATLAPVQFTPPPTTYINTWTVLF
jgi:hypothetical protein